MCEPLKGKKIEFIKNWLGWRFYIYILTLETFGPWKILTEERAIQLIINSNLAKNKRDAKDILNKFQKDYHYGDFGRLSCFQIKKVEEGYKGFISFYG